MSFNDYSRTYRVLGNIGAIGAAYMAHRYQMDDNAVQRSLGTKGWSISYPKNIKKNNILTQSMAFGRAQRGNPRYLVPYTPPRTPQRRRLNPTVAQLRRRLRMSSTNRFKATIAALNRKNLGTYQRVSKSNKYLPKTKTVAKATRSAVMNNSHGYAGGVGKTYKLKKTMELKILNKGALRNIEYKGVSTGIETVFLGHANYPTETLYVQFWMAVIKTLLVKVGASILDFSQLIPTNHVGDVVRFIFKDNYQTSIASSTGVVIPGVTWAQYIEANIRNTFIAKNNQFQLIAVQYEPAGGSPYAYTRMWCKNAKVMIHSESTMTYQNRTPPGVDITEQDVIDNQPVKAVMYYGNGNGTQMKDIQGATVNEYVAGGKNGVIDVVPLAANNDQLEPPEPHFFSSCKRTGAVILDPGQSKTSVLRDTKYMTISSFFSYVFGLERTDNTRSLIKLGKHKILGFEKIIDCVELQPQINIGFECNLRIGVVFYPGANQYSSPLYESSYK